MSERQITNAFRDRVSGAVIIDDDEAYAQARKRKQIADENSELKSQVNTLKSEVSQIKELVQNLITGQQQNG